MGANVCVGIFVWVICKKLTQAKAKKSNREQMNEANNSNNNVQEMEKEENVDKKANVMNVFL